jgi:hypothetical protein
MRKNIILYTTIIISILLIITTNTKATPELYYGLTYNTDIKLYNYTSNTTTTILNNSNISLLYDFSSNTDTGKYIIIAGATADINGNFTLYTSNNYGSTITQAITIDPAYTGSLGISSIGDSTHTCMSSDGKYQYYNVLYSLSPGIVRFYYSNDYGETFNINNISISGVTAIGSIGCSKDGKYVAFNFDVGTSTEGLKASDDYGSTFTYFDELGNNLYYTLDKLFIDDIGLNLYTNEYNINLINESRKNYTSTLSGNNIYYDNNNDYITSINGLGQGYIITGSIDDNDNYNSISINDTNCYTIAQASSQYIILSCSGNTYLSTDYGENFIDVTLIFNGSYTRSLLIENISNNYTIPTTNTTINYTTNYTIIDDNYFSKIQCMNVVDSIDYVCNNSFYNPYDNSFYCDIDNVIPCSVGTDCVTFLYDNTSNELFIVDDEKSCSTIVNTYTSINVKCVLEYGISTLSPLFSYLTGIYGYDCNVLNTYPLDTSTFCSDETINNIISIRENDTFYSEGQCIETGCVSTCTPNTYRCGSLQQSQVCRLSNITGCYDWEVNNNCLPGYVCRESTGVCGLILNNSGTTTTDATTTATDDFLAGTGLSSGMKYLVVILTLVITIISFAYIGNSAGATKMGMITGLVIAIFEFIAFSVLGWIPIWILATMILFSIITIIFALFFKSSGGE